MALATPHTEVPLIRRKVAEVMRRSGLTPSSHAGKALMNALDSYPRDELFQIGEDQLFEFATLIANLPDRPRVRVLPRIDRFDNFVSILVYLPRERYNSDVRARIGAPPRRALRWPRLGLLPALPRRRAGPRPLHHRARRRHDAAIRRGDELEAEVERADPHLRRPDARGGAPTPKR